MPPISKSRSFFGRLSILTVTAIALPLTATTIPIAAQDKEIDAKEVDRQDEEIISENIIQEIDDASTVKKVSIIKVKNDDDKKIRTIKISSDISNDEGVQTIEKEGKIFHISSEGELDQEKIEKIIADAEKSIEDIDFSAIEDSITKSFVIKSDTDGEIKTFNIIGDKDSSSDHRVMVFRSDDGSIENITDGKDLKFIVQEKVRIFQKKDLEELKANMRNNVIPSIKETLKNSELSKKEQKKIIKELEIEIEQLDKTLNELQLET